MRKLIMGAVVAVLLVGTVLAAACGGGDAKPTATVAPSAGVEDAGRDLFRIPAEGEFIDTKPIKGSSGAWVSFRGGLPGAMSRAEGVVVADITEVVDVTIPIRPVPPSFPVSEVRGQPLTTYTARVREWIKGSGPAELRVTQFGGITESGPEFYDGFFLLQPSHAYVLSLFPKDPGLPTQADYVASVNGFGAFEVTDAKVHVLNNPMTQELQAQFGGMALADFVEVVRGYVTQAASQGAAP